MTLDALTRSTQASGTDLGLGIEAPSRALLSTGDDAENLYREAIDRLGRTTLRPELARAHLLYGAWLRRENRRADARAELRTADETMAALGMEAFAERAGVNSWPSGARARTRTVGTVTPPPARKRPSPGSPATGAPTPRSAHSSSSAAAPPRGISAKVHQARDRPRCEPMAARASDVWT
ncbi:hypothetical protein [Streptomyces sp. NPDC004726]